MDNDSRIARFVSSTLLALLAACNPSSSSPDGTAMDSGSRCVPGTVIACPCAAGTNGAQTCNGDGGYGACTCFDAGIDAQTPDVPASDEAGRDAPTDIGVSMDRDVALDVAIDARDVFVPPVDGGETMPLAWDGTLPANDVCSIDGWCARSPLPTANVLRAVWGTGPGDVWAVGDQATILHWNGTAWRGITGATGTFGDQFVAVGGSGSNDVWVLGTPGNLLFRWDGTHFTSVPVATTSALRAISARAMDDVWAVGDAGTVVHWNGTAWTPRSSGTTSDLTSVQAFATNDVWAVGGHGTAIHFDGTTWSSQATGLPATLAIADVWGDTSSSLYVASVPAYHWNGSVWAPLAGSLTSGRALAVSGRSASDVEFVYQGLARHWNGTTFRIDSGLDADDVYSAASDDVFLVGGVTSVTDPSLGAYVARFQSGTPQLLSSHPFITATSALSFAWSAGPGDSWALGSGSLFHGDGTVWTAVDPGVTGVRAVSGSAANDVWVVAGTAVSSHWNGSHWAPTTVGSAVSLLPVRSISSTEAWTAGGSAVYEWNGTAWIDRMLPATTDTVFAIAATSHDDAWAFAGAHAYHYDGSTWRMSTTGLMPVGSAAAWATTSGEAWLAIAGGGVQGLAHWNGVAWENLTHAGPSAAYDVVMTGPGNVWGPAGGTGRHEAFHWNSGSWTPQWSGDAIASHSVRAGLAGDVWLLGDDFVHLQHAP